MDRKQDETPSAVSAPPHVVLDVPLIRGSQTITEVALRRPLSGDLRGLALTDIARLDVTALGKLLPRISTPALTEADVARLDPADLLALGGEIAGFFMRKADAFPST